MQAPQAVSEPPSVPVDSTDEDREPLADLDRGFALKSLGPHRGRSAGYPLAPLFLVVIEQAAEVGFFGINLVDRHARFDMDAAMVSVIVEKFCEVDASPAALVFTNGEC